MVAGGEGGQREVKRGEKFKMQSPMLAKWDVSFCLTNGTFAACKMMGAEKVPKYEIVSEWTPEDEPIETTAWDPSPGVAAMSPGRTLSAPNIWVPRKYWMN